MTLTQQNDLRNSSDDSTSANYQLYDLTSQGKSPVKLADVKEYLGFGKNTTNCNDELIQTLIDSCTAWGEGYTAREFTANTYDLFLDCFEDRISLRRNPIDAIDTVKYLVSAALVTVASSVYYLKSGVQISEVLLQDGQEWPTDGDTIEHLIQITFTTKAINARKLSMAKNAIMRHVIYMFENRGDCSDCGSCAGKDQAGATPIYDLLRIARI